MSKELKNIEGNIMSQIHKGNIKMKPKIYFILGSVLTFMGLISTIIISIFMVGLITFSLRTHYGPGAQYKLERMLTEFPWWIIIIALVGLVLGIWLIKKYDFTYKIKSPILIVGFILSVLIAGFIVDKIGINDNLMKGRGMRRMINIDQDGNLPIRRVDWRR